jgi:peptidoglycan/xylan/chitin deacetylase (PgdA/CDA1 family)
LIMHDGYNASGGDRSETVKAVAELCGLLSDRGFTFVRVDELP